MLLVRHVIAAFHYVGRLFLHDASFAAAIMSVFGVAALMLALEADIALVGSTIALGCLAVTMEFGRRDRE